MWFDTQDLGNLTYNPSTPILRLENKAGAGYANGIDPTTGNPPALIGVSPLNNKRTVFFNNPTASGREGQLQIFDTPALRPGGGEFTVFFVGMCLDDTVDYIAGLVGFRGQNDLGTVEEANWLTKEEENAGSFLPEYRAYSKTASVASAVSYGILASGSEFDPFYTTAIFRTGASTSFYENGTSVAGSATITTRYLDGDGFIGAGLSSDCATPTDFMYGYFGELIVYNRELTSDEIDSVNAWLAEKWGF
jgi:hypothetical protein